MFKASGYGQGSDPLNTKGAMLLSQSFQGRIIRKEKGLAQYCSFAQDCVLHETRACGGGGQMTAQDFARAMLDKSLGFLLKQCQVRGGILSRRQRCLYIFEYF